MDALHSLMFRAKMVQTLCKYIDRKIHELASKIGHPHIDENSIYAHGQHRSRRRLVSVSN